MSVKPGVTPIPVVFHNLQEYDSHLIMQVITETEGNLTCNNMDRSHMSFSIGQLRFVESAQFLLASLDKLVKSNDPDSLLIVREYEPHLNRVGLFLKKGIYPYEYMDDFELTFRRNESSSERRF